MIPIYLDHVPAGSSTRPFVHYAQLSQLERQFRDHSQPTLTGILKVFKLTLALPSLTWI